MWVKIFPRWFYSHPLADPLGFGKGSAHHLWHSCIEDRWNGGADLGWERGTVEGALWGGEFAVEDLEAWNLFWIV